MATVYVSSVDGNDADDGSTWALADATLAASLTAAGNGGISYVDNAHSEAPGAAISLTGGTAASPTSALCATRSTGAPPTASASTGVVSTNGNAALTVSGYLFLQGLTLRAGSGSSQGNASVIFGNTLSAAGFWCRLRSGRVEINSTSGTPRIQVGASNTNFDDRLIEWIDVAVKFGATAQGIATLADLLWRGGSVDAAGAVPTALFRGSTSALASARVVVEDVDLSALGTGTALVDVATSGATHFVFRRCKLGASVAITTGTHPGPGGPTIELINCDSGDTNYRYYRATYRGVEQHETTIVRSGGASDGTTTVSRKIVTSANTSAVSPYESPTIEYWNETTGSSVTLTVPILTDNVTLTDAEAWLEVDHLGTSGVPLGVLVTDRVSDPPFGTPANQTTDGTSSWTTTGLGTPVKQSLSVSVTPQEKGLIRVRVIVAKASTTVYYDPKVLATSGRQYQGAAAYMNEGASGGGTAAIFVVGD